MTSTTFAELTAALLMLILWLAGIVLANGFWSTLSAVCFPLWALYLVMERALSVVGWI